MDDSPRSIYLSLFMSKGLCRWVRCVIRIGTGITLSGGRGRKSDFTIIRDVLNEKIIDRWGKPSFLQHCDWLSSRYCSSWVPASDVYPRWKPIEQMCCSPQVSFDSYSFHFFVVSLFVIRLNRRGSSAFVFVVLYPWLKLFLLSNQRDEKVTLESLENQVFPNHWARPWAQCLAEKNSKENVIDLDTAKRRWWKLRVVMEAFALSSDDLSYQRTHFVEEII